MTYNARDVMSLLWYICRQYIWPVFAPCIIYLVFFHWREVGKMYGKIVLITGASSGLGEQLAHSFYKKGCKLILAARRIEELERVKNELLALDLSDTTHEPEILLLDLSDLEGIPKKAEAALAIFGQIDILVNNAGISHRGEILKTDIDVDMKIMKVNYFGTIALTKAILPSMIEKKKGHIVNIGSVQGRIGIPFRSAYGASKHALQSFMDCLRAEVQDKGIHVTVINAGYIKTNLSVNALTGSGDTYGVMDEATNSGYDPAVVAEAVYLHTLNKTEEITFASLIPKTAIMLRTVYPPLFFFLMARRAQKSKNQ